MDAHEDIRWFRRGRKCLTCGHLFLTGELSETFIDELVELRSAWLSRVKRNVIAARTAAAKRSRVETVSLDDAKAFVAAVAKWDHPSGQIVAARRHSGNIYEHSLGWAVDFGANTFLAGMAIARSFRELGQVMGELESGTIVFRQDAIRRLMTTISGCVANHDGNEYSGFYPISGNYLSFGTQLVDTNAGAQLILQWGDPKRILLTGN